MKTRPRGFRIEDAYNLALAMGVSFVELCGIAQGRMLEEEMREEAVHAHQKNEDSKDKIDYISTPVQSSENGARIES